MKRIFEFIGTEEDVEMFLDVIFALNSLCPYDDVKIKEL